MRKRTLALPLAVLLVPLVFPTWTAPDKDPQQVEVTNFPPSQNVNGVVSVANLPLDQDGRLLIGQPKPFRFVGVTTQRFDGAAGWALMTTACFDEFGGRVAFSDEYMMTVNPPTVGETSWIQPRPIFNNGSTSGRLFDAAGTRWGSAENCLSWTTASGSGGVLVPHGNLTGANCAIARPVACAARE